MRVVDKNEMKEIESIIFDEYGFNESLFIENIGFESADFIERKILNIDSHLDPRSYNEIIVLVGNGNNGADGMAIARHLQNRHHRVHAFLLFPDDSCTEELKKQTQLAYKFGVKVSEVKDADQLKEYFTQSQDDVIIIDAILGLGFRLPLSNYLFDIINLANESATTMISVDIPTGITGDTGAISSVAIQADYTLAIALPKTGHYISAGPAYIGEMVIIDRGVPSKALQGGDKALLTIDKIRPIYQQRRNRFAHKNTFGHCLVLGGSAGLTGALIMASKAALKVGTGLVTAATWKSSYLELVSRITPEVMTGIIPLEKEEAESVLKNLKRYDSIVIGPGLGMGSKTREAVLEVMAYFDGPVVVDADAIKVLSYQEDKSLFQNRKAPTILTPHIGEFAHFINKTVPEVLERPIEYLKEVVDGTNSAIILKGACSYLGFPSGEIFINYFPNDGMASGGSGDVLAGMLGGFLAQSIHNARKEVELFSDKSHFYDALKLGVAIHTLSGKHASVNLGVRSMTAASIIDYLPEAFFELDQFQNVVR